MNNGTYYAVYGKDALGVYTNLNWAKRITEYIRNPEIVRCSSLKQAFCMARDNYNDYQMGKDVDSAYYGDSFDIKLNQVLFRSEIVKINASN